MLDVLVPVLEGEGLSTRFLQNLGHLPRFARIYFYSNNDVERFGYAGYAYFRNHLKQFGNQEYVLLLDSDEEWFKGEEVFSLLAFLQENLDWGAIGYRGPGIKVREPIKLVDLGCVLVRREILENIEFKFTVDDRGLPLISDNQHFTRDVKQLGFKIGYLEKGVIVDGYQVKRKEDRLGKSESSYSRVIEAL